MITEIAALYDTYLSEALRVEQARKPGEGIFGIGKKPSDDPCHDRFISDLGAMLDDFCRSQPASSDVSAVLKLIFRAPKEHPEPTSAYWVLIAAQKLALPLIPLLTLPDAAALVSEYAATYKRWERLPVQKQIYLALKQASK